MPRNIVVVVLDTVRKDYFDEYAARLRERSDASFEQVRATSPWSVPSHASLFTGQLPSQHHLHAEHFGADTDFGEALRGRTFLDDLEGYATFGVSANVYMNEAFGFDGLFEEFRNHSIGDHWHAAPFPEARTEFDLGVESTLGTYRAAAAQALADRYPGRALANVAWLKVRDVVEALPVARFGDNGARATGEAIREYVDDAEEPFFVFANYMDAHNPLQNSRVYDQSLHDVPDDWSSNEYDKWELLIDGRATEEYTANYRALYGAAVEYLDRTVADLLADLESATSGETTVIVTADHGHNLGYDHEDGYFHHTSSLSEGVLHVPFEVYNTPDSWPARVTERVSLAALPALVELLVADAWDADRLDGRPVVAESVGLLGQGDGIDHATATTEDEDFWRRMIRCGYLAEEKFEWDSQGRSRRWGLDADRPCWQELRETDCAVPDVLRERFEEDVATYKGRWRGREQDAGFDEDVVENLQDLGYL